MAAGCVSKNLSNHRIIVTPVSSPSTKSNGHANINNGLTVRDRMHIRQNISARYAVNYRSVSQTLEIRLSIRDHGVVII